MVEALRAARDGSLGPGAGRTPAPGPRKAASRLWLAVLGVAAVAATVALAVRNQADRPGAPDDVSARQRPVPSPPAASAAPASSPTPVPSLTPAGASSRTVPSTLPRAVPAAPAPRGAPRWEPSSTPRPTAVPPSAAPPPSSTPEPAPRSPVAAASPESATPSPEADGWLLVVVTPWAEVSVDNRAVGQTPLRRLALPPGPHAVLLEHP